MAAPVLLRTENLRRSFGRLAAVDGVDFEVSAGELRAVIGPKMGILPARRGRVLFDGRDVTHLPAHEIARRGITLVPEDRRIFPRLTVAENLRVAARARGGHESVDQLERVFAYFPRLRERLRQSGQSLSGGAQCALRSEGRPSPLPRIPRPARRRRGAGLRRHRGERASHELAMKNMELFAREVMPDLRAEFP